VFELRWIFERTRFDECLNVFGRILAVVRNPRGTPQPGGAAHSDGGVVCSLLSSSSMSMLCSIMYFASRQKAIRMKYKAATLRIRCTNGGINRVCTPPPMIIAAIVKSIAHSAGGNTRALKRFVR